MTDTNAPERMAAQLSAAADILGTSQTGTLFRDVAGMIRSLAAERDEMENLLEAALERCRVLSGDDGAKQRATDADQPDAPVQL